MAYAHITPAAYDIFKYTTDLFYHWTLIKLLPYQELGPYSLDAI